MKTTSVLVSTRTTKQALESQDPDVAAIIAAEEERQQKTIDLIPSENFVSRAVREASSTVLMNKYSEGYPGKRYYQGNKFTDSVEALAIERAKTLFGAEHVNVQPNSGSPANQAVFMAFLKHGDPFMGLDLIAGGHLTHGSKVNMSGKFFTAIPYTVDEKTETIDIDAVRKLARQHKPKLIISGWTAYPRRFDFRAFQDIAEDVGAVHLADISHIAGLVAGGAHASPLPFTDIVMTTTHKTLRGPRGAILMCKEKYAKDIDRAVFPGLQGGPHEHTIAAKAVALAEAATDEFKSYAHQIVTNAKVLAESLMEHRLKLVTGGTDTHLILINLRPIDIGLGRKAALALEQAGIVTNANTVPFEPSSPFKPSGIRIGTPFATTRGMKEPEMKQLGQWIAEVIHNLDDENLHRNIRSSVEELCSEFPLDI